MVGKKEQKDSMVRRINKALARATNQVFPQGDAPSLVSGEDVTRYY